MAARRSDVPEIRSVPIQSRLVCYASPGFIEPMNVLLRSAKAHGIGSYKGWTRDEFEQLPIYRPNRDIFDAVRGNGYWAWKPALILHELTTMRADDVLIYWDVGRPERPNTIDRSLDDLCSWVVAERDGMLPGLCIPQWGCNKRWTKQECFVAMGCDSDRYLNHPQVQATFSVWQAHERSRAFVAEWLRWCLDARAVADERVDPSVVDAENFIDHRHDQSVLTNLVIAHDLQLFGRLDEVPPLDKNICALAERVSGQRSALSLRIARTAFRERERVTPSAGTTRHLRRAARFLRALIKAVRTVRNPQRISFVPVDPHASLR